MPLISKSTVQAVSDRLDAIAVVSDYVQLEKRGGRWWGLCPFHQEKTGSFTVNPDLKAYHCFGCGKGGSVISFVMEMDKLSFPEAVEFLAKRFGVEIIYDSAGPDSGDGRREERNKKREELFELYRRVAGTFQYFLTENAEGEAAKRYIISRGLTKEMMERFRLGYSPADRRWLFRFLSQKGYSKEFLAASGLFSSRYPGIPLFSGRLMFPIADRQGRVVAFGGRILEEATGGGRPSPKYINSPEMETYKKGETLFAIDLALPEIRKTGTVYIAEGYMDVIALHQAGIANAAAPLGTAFTDDQARLLRRWADKLVLVFDSDKAGQEAALKGILTGRRNGFSCFVVVPGGEPGADLLGRDSLTAGEGGGSPAREAAPTATAPKDPADILKNLGPQALQKKMKCFINDFEYLIIRAKSLYDIRDSEGKARAVAFVFPYLETLDSEVARDTCIEAAADAFGVNRSSAADDYRRFGQERAGFGNRERVKGINSPKEEFSRQSQGTQSPQIRMNEELSLLMAVAVHDMAAGTDRLYPRFRSVLTIKEIEDPAAKELFIALEECFINDETGMDALLSRIFSPELKKYIIERGMSKEFSTNLDRLVTDGIKKVTRKRLERRLDEIVIKLRGLKNDAGKPWSGNQASPDGKLEELLSEKMHIDAELRRL